jgi:type I restriction enzyme S subunit
LYYFLSSPTFRNWSGASDGANIKNIRASELAKFQVPLPPLETQKQIATVLEKTDQLRKDCQQMEQELNSLAQSVFIDMFGDPVTNPKGWDKRPLLELVADKDDIKCGPFGTQLGKSEFTTEGVPLWGIKHVNSGFKKPTVEFVSHEKALDLKAYSIVGGDIVMTRKGNVGNCYIYPDNLQSGIMHSDLLRIRPCNSTVSASFLQKQFMYSKDVEGQLKLISQGAIMPGVNVTKLKSLMLLSPPLEEQKKFETFLSEVEANKITLAHKLRESNNMFNSLLQKAFKGELNL